MCACEEPQKVVLLEHKEHGETFKGNSPERWDGEGYPTCVGTILGPDIFQQPPCVCVCGSEDVHMCVWGAIF